MSFSVPDLLSGLVLLGEPDCGHLVLVRHGEARSPDDPGAAARSDPPLTERGEQQARTVARRIAQRTVHAVYASPLKRARRTGEHIGRHLELPVREKPGLREVDFDREAALEALEAGELDASGVPDPTDRLTSFRWNDLPYAEDRDAFRARVKRTLDGLVEEHPGETVVAATHTGVINAFLSECLDLESDFWVLPAHTGISTVRTHGDRRVIVSVNDYAHLRSVPRTG